MPRLANRKAGKADEEEICADPELAQADRNIARLWRLAFWCY
jgi:uncharacterized protein